MERTGKQVMARRWGEGGSAAETESSDVSPGGGGQWEVVREGFLETPAPKDE